MATPAVIDANVPINEAEQGLPISSRFLSPISQSLAASLAVGALVAGGLVLTNPTPADLEAFAAESLPKEISDELCKPGGLPMAMRLTISNCPALVAAQKGVLGRVVREQAQRQNFGLFSLYRASIGGQNLLNWQVPRYQATVLGIAGNFVLVQSAATPNP
ncbi:DUF4359 domain-containing protein [Cyanobium sp. WAJ14-Wanaka]|uniref:DUF4359 domain-containing protein n=1 Tax=Cyanobium sp. WAJ14-Wanaka TaxID=2823725 RepID=UPI0020CEFAB0|nr:DUF4359 domain-containing protein [Cyanobium sp. WAJ14-Wanaka]MCP9774092.1 DUF4359 domain-containing protein [Cyanobium sp. WAJ14-Wanaka]